MFDLVAGTLVIMTVSFQWAGVPGSLTGQGGGGPPQVSLGTGDGASTMALRGRGGHDAAIRMGCPQSGPWLLAGSLLLLEHGFGTEPQMPPLLLMCLLPRGLGPKLKVSYCPQDPGDSEGLCPHWPCVSCVLGPEKREVCKKGSPGTLRLQGLGWIPWGLKLMQVWGGGSSLGKKI